MFRKLFVLFLIVELVLCQNPGVRLQANQNAINYMKNVGLTILSQKVKGLTIPNISGSESIFDYWVTNMRITSFSVPANLAKIILTQPNGVAISVGLSANLAANYKVRVGPGWMHIDHEGSITASASGSGSVKGALVAIKGKGQVTLSSCRADISHLSIEFHGNLIDDILNLLKSIVEDMIKSKLSGIVCQEIGNVVRDTLNKELASFPTSIEDHSTDFFNNFGIDYSLVGNPVVEGTTASLGLMGKLWYQGHQNDPQIPKALPTPAIKGSSKMFCVNLDAQEVIGSGGYALKVSNKAHLLLDKAFVTSLGLGSIAYMFDCNCIFKCIGGMIPPVKPKCGNGTIQIGISLGNAPTAHVNASGAFIGLQGTADFSAKLPNNSVVPLFSVDATFGAIVLNNVSFDNWKIRGSVKITDSELSVKSSNVGKIDQFVLQLIWKLVLTIVVQHELDTLAQKGIPLPAVPDFEVLNPELKFGDHTLTLCFDAKFTGFY